MSENENVEVKGLTKEDPIEYDELIGKLNKYYTHEFHSYFQKYYTNNTVYVNNPPQMEGERIRKPIKYKYIYSQKELDNHLEDSPCIILCDLFYNDKKIERTNFRRFIFTCSVNFNKATFNNHGCLEASTFMGLVDFERSIFKDKMWFNNSIFYDMVNFEYAIFEDHAFFYKVNFKGNIFFTHTIFIRQAAWFETITFNKEAYMKFHSMKFAHNDVGESIYHITEKIYKAQNRNDDALDMRYQYQVYRRKKIYGETIFEKVSRKFIDKYETKFIDFKSKNPFSIFMRFIFRYSDLIFLQGLTGYFLNIFRVVSTAILVILISSLMFLASSIIQNSELMQNEKYYIYAPYSIRPHKYYVLDNIGGIVNSDGNFLNLSLYKYFYFSVASFFSVGYEDLYPTGFLISTIVLIENILGAILLPIILATLARRALG